jgi:hypothetical protein
MGNIIPFLFWLLPTGLGVAWMMWRVELQGLGLYLLIAGSVLGWLALNQFGLFENGRMRRDLERTLRARGVDLVPDRVFVGIATPRHQGRLDPHEDVGFLFLFPDRATFISETRTLDLNRHDIREIRFRPNVHSLVGLGRWISFEAVQDGRPIRLMVEPRERKTLLGNLRRGKPLLERFRRWQRDGGRVLETKGA